MPDAFHMFSDQVSLCRGSRNTKIWPATTPVEGEHLSKHPPQPAGKEFLWKKWNAKTALEGHQWVQGEGSAGGKSLETFTVGEKRGRTSKAGQEENSLVVP